MVSIERFGYSEQCNHGISLLIQAVEADVVLTMLMWTCKLG